MLAPDWPLIGKIVLPFLTALIGYWFARRETDRRIIAERRADAASRFIEKAYFNLRYLLSRDNALTSGAAGAELTILGEQVRFFVSAEVAAQVDAVATQFVMSLNDKVNHDPDERGDPWKEYNVQVDLARDALRAELDVGGPLIRLPLRWRLRRLKAAAARGAISRPR